jgi:hypothetical protein
MRGGEVPWERERERKRAMGKGNKRGVAAWVQMRWTWGREGEEQGFSSNKPA